jgi:hypothetical protein
MNGFAPAAGCPEAFAASGNTAGRRCDRLSESASFAPANMNAQFISSSIWRF